MELVDKLFVFLLVFLLPVAIHGQAVECQNTTNTLEFLFMTSFSESINSSGNAVGMMIALDRINANTSILPDYNLSYTTIIDTQCNRSKSLAQFFEMIRDPCRRFIAVIGSGCTEATAPVAEILHYWGLSQISYVSNSAEFRYTTAYPQYIQLYPSEDNFNPGIVAGIVYFGWEQVVILTQDESVFVSNRGIITELLQNQNVTVLETRVIETSENEDNISDIFPEDGHIFFINAYEIKARQILCQAYQRGLYGPNYVWLVFGWYDKEWWRKDDGAVSCTIDNMDTVIDHALTIQQLPVTSDADERAVGDMTFNEYFIEYNQKRIAFSYDDVVTTSHITYDATWTLAFALDEAERRLRNGDLGICAGSVINDTLEEWSYSRNATTSCLVYQALLNTRFNGLSGDVTFDVNGTRQPVLIRLSQYREGKLILFAVSGGGDIDYLEGESDDSIFPAGTPPDGSPIVTITTYHTALIVIVYILAIVGLSFLCVCLVFIIYFRNNKIISLGTNVLNYCILLGIAMILASLFFRVHSSKDKDVILAFCYISLWLFNLGYVVAFSAILAKMGRIYYVFFYPSKQKKISLTNLHLLSVVAVLSLIMGVILLFGSALPITRLAVFLDNDLEQSPRKDERGVRQSFEYYRCYRSSSALNIWLLIMFIFTAMLQISAIVLVLQTRRVKIKALNDSKPVAAIVYVTSVVLVTILIVSFAFPSYQNLSESILSLSLIITCYSMLLLIFIPKMINVYKDLYLEKEAAETVVEVDKKGVLKVINDTETINSLYNQVDELETALETKKGIRKDSKLSINTSDDTITYSKGHVDSQPSYKDSNNGTNNSQTVDIHINDVSIDDVTESDCEIHNSTVVLVNNEQTNDETIV